MVMDRRRFMMALGGVGLSLWRPLVDPSEVDVDEKKLKSATDWIQEKIAERLFPGAAILAARSGKPFLEGYWGSFCDVEERDNPVGPDVVHMLYSFSKGVTSTLVVSAEADGLFDYDDSVHEYIPEFRKKGKDVVTVRHLLTHSAGLPSVPASHALGEEAWQRNLQALCEAELEWPPGSRTAYHGWQGMFLAAEVVRRVTGMQSWETICQERLFKPLGTDSFTFEAPPPSATVSLTPQPKELPCPVTPQRFGLMGHPGGGCFGTIHDMLKLLQLHLQDGVWVGKQLISTKALRAMRKVQFAQEIAAAKKRKESPAHEYWGLGWLLRGDTKRHWFGFGKRLSPKAFGHAGIDTVMGIADPERELCLAFLTTHSPPTQEMTVEIRNGVTDRIAEAVR